MTNLYNSTNGLDETGKYNEPPLTGYANVFEPPERNKFHQMELLMELALV
jgi:hypothetical protein